MNFEHLTPAMGTITDITAYNDDCCSQFVSLSVDGQQIHIIMTHDTFVVDTMRLFPGMRIAAFYDSTQPVPLIYPPQYRADLIAVLRPEEDVAIGYVHLPIITFWFITRPPQGVFPRRQPRDASSCCARPLKVYMDGILPALMAIAPSGL